MALSQGTISTVAWLPVRAVVLLSVPLRKSIVAKCSQNGESTIILLPVSVGHSGQPLCLREACANLGQNSGCVKSSRVKITRNYLRDFGLARSLRVHELARSLWKACARVTPFNFLQNKFHRILKSIAGSFERGSLDATLYVCHSWILSSWSYIILICGRGLGDGAVRAGNHVRYLLRYFDESL